MNTQKAPVGQILADANRAIIANAKGYRAEKKATGGVENYSNNDLRFIMKEIDAKISARRVEGEVKDTYFYPVGDKNNTYIMAIHTGSVLHRHEETLLASPQASQFNFDDAVFMQFQNALKYGYYPAKNLTKKHQEIIARITSLIFKPERVNVTDPKTGQKTPFDLLVVADAEGGLHFNIDHALVPVGPGGLPKSVFYSVDKKIYRVDVANFNASKGIAGVSFLRRGFPEKTTNKYIGFVSTIPHDQQKPHAIIIDQRASYINKEDYGFIIHFGYAIQEIAEQLVDANGNPLIDTKGWLEENKSKIEKLVQPKLGSSGRPLIPFNGSDDFEAVETNMDFEIEKSKDQFKALTGLIHYGKYDKTHVSRENAIELRKQMDRLTNNFFRIKSSGVIVMPSLNTNDESFIFPISDTVIANEYQGRPEIEITSTKYIKGGKEELLNVFIQNPVVPDKKNIKRLVREDGFCQIVGDHDALTAEGGGFNNKKDCDEAIVMAFTETKPEQKAESKEDNRTSVEALREVLSDANSDLFDFTEGLVRSLPEGIQKQAENDEGELDRSSDVFAEVENLMLDTAAKYCSENKITVQHLKDIIFDGFDEVFDELEGLSAKEIVEKLNFSDDSDVDKSDEGVRRISSLDELE